MDDPELDRIRNQRLAALRSQSSSGSGSPLSAGFSPAPGGQGGRGGSGGGNGGGNGESEEAQRAREEEMKAQMLAQILDQGARERLNRLALTRPQKEHQVVELLLRMGRSGQIRNRVTEDELKNILDQLDSATATNQNSIKVVRRKAGDEDEDFDLDDDDFGRGGRVMGSSSTGTAKGGKAGKAPNDEDDDFDW